MSITQARREREKVERRSAIVDAAERVFAERGFGTASMDEVAVEAEFSKGLLYKYFESKEDLYEAVSLRAHRLLLQWVKEADTAHASGLDRAVAVGEAYIRFAREHPAYFEALVFHATQDPNENPSSNAALGEEVAEAIIDVVTGIIEGGIKDGSLRNDLDARQSAFTLWGALHGLVVTATFKNPLQRHRRDPDTFLRNAVDFLTSCLKAS